MRKLTQQTATDSLGDYLYLLDNLPAGQWLVTETKLAVIPLDVTDVDGGALHEISVIRNKGENLTGNDFVTERVVTSWLLLPKMLAMDNDSRRDEPLPQAGISGSLHGVQSSHCGIVLEHNYGFPRFG